MEGNKYFVEIGMEELEKEKDSCDNEIRKIDIEIAKLQERRLCIDDRKTMLWGFMNR